LYIYINLTSVKLGTFPMKVCNYDTSVLRIIHMYISISLVFRVRYKALCMCLITLAV